MFDEDPTTDPMRTWGTTIRVLLEKIDNAEAIVSLDRADDPRSGIARSETRR